jgi:hypothetical protein
MPQQLPQIAILPARYPDLRKVISEYSFQNQLGILAIHFLFAYSLRSNLGCVSDPQLKLQLGEQSFKPARMPARLLLSPEPFWLVSQPPTFTRVQGADIVMESIALINPDEGRPILSSRTVYNISCVGTLQESVWIAAQKRHRMFRTELVLRGFGMQSYEFINKEWIVSPTARRVYRISASLSVALFVGLWVVLFEGGIADTSAPIARLLLFVGALGAGITFVGMEYFLFRFDDSRPLKQVVWFCVMLFPLLGAALYCFLVYSRSNALKSSAKHAEDASV